MSAALVLSNALGTTRAVWNRQVPALERHFRLLRYEHRGQDSVGRLGRDVLELLDAAGVDRASFCGVSLGGAVGMWLAANAPERIDRLVLSSTSSRFGPPEVWRQRAELVRNEGTAPLVDATMDRWFTPRFQDREPFRRMLLETQCDDYGACCEAIAAWDFRDGLTKISAPTLVVAGAEDPSTPPEHAELIAGQIPGAALVILPESAHLANVEQSELFNAAVLEHLVQEVSR
ncbi:MAG: alpha/beta fold hydrolase [Gaiellaceae bacterium]